MLSLRREIPKDAETKWEEFIEQIRDWRLELENLVSCDDIKRLVSEVQELEHKLWHPSLQNKEGSPQSMQRQAEAEEVQHLALLLSIRFLEKEELLSPENRAEMVKRAESMLECNEAGMHVRNLTIKESQELAEKLRNEGKAPIAKSVTSLHNLLSKSVTEQLKKDFRKRSLRVCTCRTRRCKCRLVGYSGPKGSQLLSFFYSSDGDGAKKKEWSTLVRRPNHLLAMLGASISIVHFCIVWCTLKSSLKS